MVRFKLLVLGGLVAGLLGCRIEIYVPEGGRVESLSGDYSCASGETCSIDVQDLFFDESFQAIADEGYRFEHWSSHHRHFCGGQREPCHLYTSALSGNALLEAILATDEVFYLQPQFSSEAAAATHRVTPEGGRFEFRNGVVLDVPPGAVDSAVDITLGELNPNKVRRALNSHVNALSRKRYLGGFSARPAMEFRVPVIAEVPVLPPLSHELPLQMEIKTGRRRHWIEPTMLEYQAERRVMRMQITHFSDLATGAVDGIDPETLEEFCTDPLYNPLLSICRDLDDLQPRECLLPRASRPPGTVCCRELDFTARSEATDFSANRASGDCEAVSDRLTITYHQCRQADGSPAPAQSHGLCEMSPHCPIDGRVGFTVDISPTARACFSTGESLQLRATVRDADGNTVPGSSVSWRSLDQRVASVGLNGRVKALRGGFTAVEATFSHECKDYAATVDLEVLDLNGAWAGTEVADERGCDEGVNTYRREVQVRQVGDQMSFSWGGTTASGTKKRCRVEGFASEFEDDGLTISRGSLNIAPNGQRMSGAADWLWRGTDPSSGQDISCSGSSDLSLSR